VGVTNPNGPGCQPGQLQVHPLNNQAHALRETEATKTKKEKAAFANLPTDKPYSETKRFKILESANPQHWFLYHMGLCKSEFKFKTQLRRASSYYRPHTAYRNCATGMHVAAFLFGLGSLSKSTLSSTSLKTPKHAANSMGLG